MGKKDGSKRKRNEFQDDDIEEVDAELQAEIAAVMASRSERIGIDKEEVNGNSREKNTYNKDGLVKSLENIETVNLPFHETMQICEYDIAIQNENDDIEREVIFLCGLYFHFLHCTFDVDGILQSYFACGETWSG